MGFVICARWILYSHANLHFAVSSLSFWNWLGIFFCVTHSVLWQLQTQRQHFHFSRKSPAMDAFTFRILWNQSTVWKPTQVMHISLLTSAIWRRLVWVICSLYSTPYDSFTPDIAIGENFPRTILGLLSCVQISIPCSSWNQGKKLHVTCIFLHLIAHILWSAPFCWTQTKLLYAWLVQFWFRIPLMLCTVLLKIGHCGTHNSAL